MGDLIFTYTYEHAHVGYAHELWFLIIKYSISHTHICIYLVRREQMTHSATDV